MLCSVNWQTMASLHRMPSTRFRKFRTRRASAASSAEAKLPETFAQATRRSTCDIQGHCSRGACSQCALPLPTLRNLDPLPCEGCCGPRRQLQAVPAVQARGTLESSSGAWRMEELVVLWATRCNVCNVTKTDGSHRNPACALSFLKSLAWTHAKALAVPPVLALPYAASCFLSALPAGPSHRCSTQLMQQGLAVTPRHVPWLAVRLVALRWPDQRC